MLINQRFKAVQNGSTGFPNYLTTGFCDDFFSQMHIVLMCSRQCFGANTSIY